MQLFIDRLRDRVMTPHIDSSFMRRDLHSISFVVFFIALSLTVAITTTPVGAQERSGLVIVMNQNIDMPSIDDAELRRLFLGKSRRLPNGARAALAAYGPDSSFFNSRILGRSDAEVSAAWSRLRFSGRTPPPRIFDNPQAVAQYVRNTSNALAYMPASADHSGLRVITNVPASMPPLL